MGALFRRWCVTGPCLSIDCSHFLFSILLCQRLFRVVCRCAVFVACNRPLFVGYVVLAVLPLPPSSLDVTQGCLCFLWLWRVSGVVGDFLFCGEGGVELYILQNRVFQVKAIGRREGGAMRWLMQSPNVSSLLVAFVRN